MSDGEKCLFCGVDIPEGRQVCPSCENMKETLWVDAENWLNRVITEYAAIGWTGSFALRLTLLPLKRRFDAGERTAELYREIMDCN